MGYGSVIVEGDHVTVDALFEDRRQSPDLNVLPDHSLRGFMVNMRYVLPECVRPF